MAIRRGEGWGGITGIIAERVVAARSGEALVADLTIPAAPGGRAAQQVEVAVIEGTFRPSEAGGVDGNDPSGGQSQARSLAPAKPEEQGPKRQEQKDQPRHRSAHDPRG